MAGATGLEPAPFGVTGRHSNQLSYAPASSRKAGSREGGRCRAGTTPKSSDPLGLYRFLVSGKVTGIAVREWRPTAPAPALRRCGGCLRSRADAGIEFLRCDLAVTILVELVEKRISGG